NFMKKNYILIIPSIFLLFSCVTSTSNREPSWVTDINSEYPENRFLAVLGQGDSISSAQKKAAANLSMIFETTISVDSQLTTKYTTLENEGVITSTSGSSTMSDNINQKSNQTLFNIKYGETWTNETGIVTVVAYLDRRETASIYSQKINSQNTDIKRLEATGDKAESILVKYAYYDSAFVLAMNNKTLIEQLGIISTPSASALLLDYNVDSLKTSRAEVLKQISFNILTSKTSPEYLKPLLESSLTDMGFTTSETAPLKAESSLNYSKIERNNEYSNYKWNLDISISDIDNNTLIAFSDSGTSVSTSDSAAISKVKTDVSKKLKKEITKQFNEYFLSFLGK
ncbi:MAG: LPP20 family lipoprotein, partial [Spirochaetales bacterium]|nr:LPP20 family lipoprotein [Spirochaetales bacterium]